MVLTMQLEEPYDIVVERGVLEKASSLLSLERKVLLVSDDGVPSTYQQTLLKQCKQGYLYVIPQGEASKSFESYQRILSFLIEKHFTRSDCVIALGGGVVGDLAGFVSASYMRGIDFYNIPTTLLSQVDSSIGGKTAVDFMGVKNIIGAFYQPKKVLIDANTLKTLDARQFSAGLVEAYKMALNFSLPLVEKIEKSKDIQKDIEDIIIEALKIKKMVVEEDVKEKGLRSVLNFGHTIGHAIEAYEEGRLLHGECVGLGMLFFSSEEVKERILKFLKKYNLPTRVRLDKDAIYEILSHDKKAQGDNIRIILCEKAGSYQIKKIPLEEIKPYMEASYEK